MAKRSPKAPATDEPRRFPPNTPGWKKVRCGLCGAEPGDNCRNLFAATSGALSGRAGGRAGEVVRIKTEAPTQKEPHAARVAAVGAGT